MKRLITIFLMSVGFVMGQGTSVWKIVNFDGSNLATNRDPIIISFTQVNFPQATITANTNLTASHFDIFVDTSSGNVTTFLPSASTEARFNIKFAAGTNDCIIEPQSGQAIDYAVTNFSLFLHEVLSLRGNGGTNWFIAP